MIGRLERINRLLRYLGKKEIWADSDGVTKFDGLRDDESFEIRNECGFKHTWDISFHNGDVFNQQVVLLTHSELLGILDKIENKYRTEVERKVKQELEVEAVKRRMLELGL